MEPLLTPAQVAERLAVSERKAYALKDLIGYVALGGNVRFEQAAVQAYIERCKRSPSIGERQEWESRSDTVPAETGGSRQKLPTANDINELLQKRRRRGTTPQSGMLN